MKNQLLTLILIFCYKFAFTQQQWGLEYRQKVGFLAAHRGVMGHLPVKQAIAGELTYFIQTKGNKKWHSESGFPTIGATFFGGSVGNNDILGTYWGAYGFIEFPFFQNKLFSLRGKMGTGLGYGTKIFDQQLNPKDVAMSTHLNALICVGFKSEFYLGRNYLSLGLDMTHFSNGAFKVPNLGINLPFASVGFGRTLQHTEKDTLVEADELPFRKWLFSVTAIGSIKEIFPTNGQKYPIFSLSTGFRWFSKPKVGFEGAFDIFSKQAILGYHPEIQKNQWDILQLGIYTGYLLPLDRFHFAIGMGVYFKDKYQPEDFMYHRLGFRYYLKNGFIAHVILKSHWARADYVEWGIGYTFNYRK